MQASETFEILLRDPFIVENKTDKAIRHDLPVDNIYKIKKVLLHT